jgi:hypothetical protein
MFDKIKEWLGRPKLLQQDNLPRQDLAEIANLLESDDQDVAATMEKLARLLGQTGPERS